MIALTLSVAWGWAHPFGSEIAAHRMEATILVTGFEVTWSVDVPERLVLEGRRGLPSEAFAVMRDEVARGVHVRVDGRTLATEIISGVPVRSDASSWVFPVTLRGEWAEVPAAEIVFSNGNLPDVVGYYRSDLELGPGVVVMVSSLLPRDPKGRLVVDRTGRWRQGAEHREVVLQLAEEPTWAWWDRELKVRELRDARPRSLAARWMGRPPAAPGGVVLIVLSLLVGGVTPRDLRWVLAGGTTAWAMISVAMWFGAPFLVAAVMGLIGVAVAERLPALGGGLVIAGLAGVAGVPWLALPVALAGLAGTAVATSDAPRLSRTLRIFAVGWLVVGGLTHAL